MKNVATKAIIVIVAGLAVSSCGNTIRGVGKDTASAINATQDAGNRVGNAAAR